MSFEGAKVRKSKRNTKENSFFLFANKKYWYAINRCGRGQYPLFPYHRIKVRPDKCFTPYMILTYFGKQ